MKSDNENPSTVLTYPVMMTLTAILCLVSYQAFGLNTAIGVATASTALTLFSNKRKSKPTATEAN